MDTVSYRSSPGKVEVTLNTSANFGDARGDMVSGFDNLIGSAFDDVLTGDSNDNVIEGLAGADTLTAVVAQVILCPTPVPMPV